MRLFDFIVWLFGPRYFGGGGGGGSSQFKAQGTPPGFDYNSAQALNQMAIGGDVQSYALSDADFANRYPALQNAYQQWQANLGNQVNAAGAATGGLQSVMGGLANQIAGRQGTPTTSDINSIRNAASTVGGAVQPIMGLGAQQAGLAQPMVNMGAQQGAMGGQLYGQGQQLSGMAATPYALGQQLLQEPIDPQTQQQMMRAGLGTTMGAGLGAASLGQGMAGQSAAARQLGLNTLQYGQAMRGEAMGDISQAASIMGQGGQLSGLGAQTIGSGAQTMGLGAGVLGQGAQTLGLGAQTAGQAGQLSNAAQQAQEQYGMDTSQMANIYGNLQNQQATNLMLNMQTAGNMFQKRPFGMGGTNMAQTELGQAGAYNSFQQANYATMNGIAFNQAQLNAQNQQMAAQQQSATTGALVSAGSTAAVVGATAAGACWVARAAFGEDSPKWRVFRHWLMNKAPRIVRRTYLVYGPSLAPKVAQNRLLGALVRGLMTLVTDRTTYICLPA
jgi:hypothetical protein